MTKTRIYLKNLLIILLAAIAFSILSLPQTLNDCDTFWNFNFILKTYNGYIPYNDFNIIIPPLYHWIGAILMHIIGNHFLLMSIYGRYYCFSNFLLFFKNYKYKFQKIYKSCNITIFNNYIISTYDLGWKLQLAYASVHNGHYLDRA